MENATTIALSRMVAQDRAMDVTATNIANASTPGFQASRMIFSDYIQPAGGNKLPGQERNLAYTQDRGTYRDRQPGAMTFTGDPLDLAINGDGFFTVRTARGPRLTRSGHFGLSPTGGIVDDSGDPLLDTAGRPLLVSPADTRLTVAGDGTLSSENGQLGRIGVVTPADPNKVKAEGGRLLSAVDTTTAPVALPKLVQGATEDSNVQATTELTRMMNDSRQFQFVAQFLQGEADRQQNTIDKLLQTHA